MGGGDTMAMEQITLDLSRPQPNPSIYVVSPNPEISTAALGIWDIWDNDVLSVYCMDIY
jgi:hypothetical protein